MATTTKKNHPVGETVGAASGAVAGMATRPHMARVAAEAAVARRGRRSFTCLFPCCVDVCTLEISNIRSLVLDLARSVIQRQRISQTALSVPGRAVGDVLRQGP